MTYGEAIQDPTTKIGQAAIQQATDRAERIRKAQAIAERDGITLEEALLSLWTAGA